MRSQKPTYNGAHSNHRTVASFFWGGGGVGEAFVIDLLSGCWHLDFDKCAKIYSLCGNSACPNPWNTNNSSLSACTGANRSTSLLAQTHFYLAQAILSVKSFPPYYYNSFYPTLQTTYCHFPLGCPSHQRIDQVLGDLVYSGMRILHRIPCI